MYLFGKDEVGGSSPPWSLAGFARLARKETLGADHSNLFILNRHIFIIIRSCSILINIIKINKYKTKQSITDYILRNLPNWFSIEKE